MITLYTVLSYMLLTSCVAPLKCVKGNGEIEKRVFDLETFDSFTVSCSADVEIEQGEKQQVTIEGESNILDLFKTEVKNGNWNIDTKQCYQTNKGVKVMIVLTDLKKISINGSGDVKSLKTMKTEDFDIDVNGSGDILLEIGSEEVNIDINGSGDVTLSGECHSMDVDVNGSGDIKAFDLETGNCDVNVNGSGDTRLNVKGHMTVKTNGSGDVHYKGTPKSLEVEDNGSGDVRDAN